MNRKRKEDINSSGLRPGNILLYDTGEGIFPTVIDWEDLKWLSEAPQDFWNNHQGCPTTEKWLLAAGFKYQDRDINRSDKVKKRFYISDHFGEHSEFWLELNIPDAENKDFRCCWLNWNIGGGRNFVHMPYPHKPMFVHELQNLYSSLSETELEFKPELLQALMSEPVLMELK